jgi:sugar-specific transcriptional regulator TrmB
MRRRIPLSDPVHHLRLLGFNELEAKCYLALSEQGGQTGYEVAKRLGASRSNVYAALQRLTDEGAALVVKGDPATYTAAPFADLRSRIESTVRHSLDALQQALPPQGEALEDFYTLEGDRQIRQRLELELARAEREIAADLWQEEAEWLAEPLLAAERRGVRTAAFIVGDATVPLRQVYTHPREESWRQRRGRKWSFVFDRRFALLGVRGEGTQAKAVFTGHPALVSLLLNNFFHDYVLHELERDLGEELARRYGRRYERLYRKLTGQGWDDPEEREAQKS